MTLLTLSTDRLCGLVVRVSGYRSTGPGLGSRCYQIFWEIVGLERGALSLVSTIKELLARNSSGSGLENREHGLGNPSRWPRDILYPQKLALTSSTSGGRSVGIVRLRTNAAEVFFLCGIILIYKGRNFVLCSPKRRNVCLRLTCPVGCSLMWRCWERGASWR
jgi:hypothetical protein